MEHTRLILLEGLPGTGKSTNSYFLYTQLEPRGKIIKWIHELARPHPVLFFGEANCTYAQYRAIIKQYPHAAPALRQAAVFRKHSVGIDLLELEWNPASPVDNDTFQALREYDVWNFPLELYTERALEKWAHFTQHALEHQQEIYILDSALLQYQIFTYLLQKAPYEGLMHFVRQLTEIVRPLQPNLLYLYRNNTQDTIGYLENLRGESFLEGIWRRDQAKPYYRDQPAGASGYKRFLWDYAAAAQRLFEAADCRKLSVEISTPDWTVHEKQILSFLGARRKSHPNALSPDGVYRNAILGQEIEVCRLSITDPNGVDRALTPKSDCEFYVESLPVVLRFQGRELIMGGDAICERWTTTGTRYIKA